MKSSTIINMSRDVKELIMVLLGALCIIVGIILLLPYIWAFFKIFLGIFIILIGISFLVYRNKWFRFKFLRF